MIRRFNYTQRKRIPRENVRVQLISSAHGPLSFDADVDVSNLELPSHASVWIEAYYRSSYMRFAWGTVGSPAPAPDRRLLDIDRGTVVFFRVKVVQGTIASGLLLAEADKIVAEQGEEPTMIRNCILPVQFTELGHQIWRVNFEGMVPVLEVNQGIDGIRNVLANDAQFMALVFPAVFREVLQHILLAGSEEDDDPDNWPSLWLRFVKQFHGEDPPTDGAEPDDRLRWVDAVVAGFCENRRVRQSFELARQAEG